MKKLNILFTVIFITFLSVLPLIAQDSGDKVLYEGQWLGVAVTIIAAIGAVTIPFIRKILSKWIEKEAVESIMIGVNNMWDHGVKAAKETAKDGKLTKEEAIEYRKGALDIALITARGPVKKYLLKRGPEWGSFIIKKAIAKFKSK